MNLVPFSRLIGPPLNTSYVAVSESTYERGLEQPMHAHDPAYLTAVISGGYEERTGGSTRDVGAGALLFHPAGEEHAVRFREPVTRAFRIQPLTAMLEAQRLARSCFETLLERAGAARRIVLRMRQAYFARDPLAPLIIDGLACELVACCGSGARRAVSDHAGALRARDQIEAALAHTPSLEALAAEAGCHPITLARAFRRTFGCSMGEYLRRRRLEAAARLLQHSDLPISTVALVSGFADQPHLTRALRRQTGHTPATLRAFKTEPVIHT